MSAPEPTSTKRSAAHDRRAVRPCRHRGRAACGLSRRTRAARVHARRPEGHRQGDACLSHGALRPRSSGPGSAGVQAATSLALDPEHPVARRVAAQAHGDLLVLERTPNDKGVLRQQIAVEDVRRTVSFFGATAGEGGWRVAIVDAVDELNRAGANALLKVLEEPPQRALLLLVCHSASRVCRRCARAARLMPMRPLAESEVAPRWPRRSARAATIRMSRPRPRRPTAASRARWLSSMRTLWRCASARSTSSTGCPRSMPTPCMRSARRSPAPIRGRSAPLSIPSMAGCRDGSIARRTRRRLARLARLAEAWERINAAARDAETYNLERKPLVFSVFGLLAEATRG